MWTQRPRNETTVNAVYHIVQTEGVRLKDLHLYYILYTTCRYKNGNHGSQSETLDEIKLFKSTQRKLFKEYTRCCHVPTLCPRLNQAAKGLGMPWALERNEGKPESPLPQAVCLPSICLLVCCTTRNQN